MTRVGAVDIGTNSVRLLVAEAGAVGAGVAEAGLGDPAADSRPAPLTVIDRRMRITRLGQGVHGTRALHPEAIERTLAVLREYRQVFDELDVAQIRAAATSAARDAMNRDDFFGPATEVLGVGPELLSGEEEAELSFAGATAGLAEPTPYLVVDIGGGSTEFIAGTQHPEGLISVDVGCVRLTEAYLHSDPPSPEELSQAVSVVRDHLADVDREVPGAAAARTLVGLAGTITTMAAVELGIPEYDAEQIHHFRLTRAAAEDVFRTLATETVEQRSANPGLEAARADVIVGGAIVAVSIMRHWGFPEMLVSESDILDGLARSIADRP